MATSLEITGDTLIALKKETYCHHQQLSLKSKNKNDESSILIHLFALHAFNQRLTNF